MDDTRWNALADERDVFYATKMNDDTVRAHNEEVMRRNKEREAANKAAEAEEAAVRRSFLE